MRKAIAIILLVLGSLATAVTANAAPQYHHHYHHHHHHYVHHYHHHYHHHHPHAVLIVH